VNTKFTNEIINSIDLLYAVGKESQNPDENISYNYNPVSELISPEWHYSESFRVLENTQINWNSLDESTFIQKAADSMEGNKIKELITGIEFERSFCAWYQSYHFWPRHKWGIHFRYDSLLRIASILYSASESYGTSKIDAVKSAFLYLFVHELFHNLVENATSIIELILGKSQVYTRYYTAVYSQAFNTCDCIEETLANSYLFVWSEHCHINAEFLKAELLKQGPGYQQFDRYLGPKFLEGVRVLLSQVRSGNLNPTAIEPIENIVGIPDPVKYTSTYYVPIWLHSKAKPVH
jgi:hypothetical protein